MGATEVAPSTSFCPFAASRIRFAKLRLPLTPLRDFLLARCSKIVPGNHPPPFSGGFRPPFTIRPGRLTERRERGPEAIGGRFFAGGDLQETSERTCRKRNDQRIRPAGDPGPLYL
jgi:hypothetical protein